VMYRQQSRFNSMLLTEQCNSGTDLEIRASFDREGGASKGWRRGASEAVRTGARSARGSVRGVGDKRRDVA
jgi:hypothetical protein